MAGRTFLAVDRASLDAALADADHLDRIVVAEGAFDAVPRLAVDGARWRLNGWAAMPGKSAAPSSHLTWPLPAASWAHDVSLPGTPPAVASGETPWGFLPSASYAATWEALDRIFADAMGAGALRPAVVPEPEPPVFSVVSTLTLGGNGVPPDFIPGKVLAASASGQYSIPSAASLVLEESFPLVVTPGQTLKASGSLAHPAPSDKPDLLALATAAWTENALDEIGQITRAEQVTYDAFDVFVIEARTNDGRTYFTNQGSLQTEWDNPALLRKDITACVQKLASRIKS